MTLFDGEPLTPADIPVAPPEPDADGAWPAQPALTPREVFLKQVRQDVTTLLGIAASLEDARLLRRSTVREEMRRTLAGVIAHAETLRLALEKGRCA